MRRRSYIRTFTFTEILRARGCSDTAAWRNICTELAERTDRSCHYQLCLLVNPGSAYCICVGCYDEESGYLDYRNHLWGCPRHRPTKRLGIKWSHAKDCILCKADIQAQIPIELTVNNIHTGFDESTIEVIRDMLDCGKPMLCGKYVIQSKVC